MTDYLEQLAARDHERQALEREQARAVIIAAAPEPDRETFLSALGLL